MRRELFLAGIAVMRAGIGFRYYAMRVLGRYFTFQLEVRAGQTVIAAGPYRYLRNSSDTGAWITVVGLGRALGNWASLIAVLVWLLIGHAYRLHVEDAAPVTSPGEPYRECKRRTTRLLPFVL